MEGISGEVREARCCRLIDISIKCRNSDDFSIELTFKIALHLF